jgi:hypothetical protein
MQFRLFAALFFIVVFSPAFAQGTSDFMIGGGFDVIKTDNTRLLDKAQVGFEANFYVITKFSVSAGVEMWTYRDESFAFGTRWYPINHLFMRFRGLIGENDFNIGLGGAIPMRRNWRIELIGDYYFAGEFALRTGLAYVIRTR